MTTILKVGIEFFTMKESILSQRGHSSKSEVSSLSALSDPCHSGDGRYAQIAAFLTQVRVPTKKMGKGWHPETVWRILEIAIVTRHRSYCERLSTSSEYASEPTIRSV